MALVNQYGREFSAVEDAGAGRTSRGPRLANVKTGMGTELDKGLGSVFVPRRMERTEAEGLYQMSWTGAKMIDVPVDDLFVRGRRWTGDDAGAIEAMEAAEKELLAMTWLGNSMKAGRIFGSALLIICTDDGKFEEPLKPEDVKEGSVVNLWVVDRWSASVQNWQTDPTKPRYARPHQYRVSGRIFGSPDGEIILANTSTTSQNVLVHHDRLIRFDGTRSPLTEGWTSGPWEREWGVSMFTRVIDEILRDVTMHAGVGHLMDEASIWVDKVQGFREMVRGRTPPGMPTIEEIATEASLMRSLYRTKFMDKADDSERVAVSFAGIAELMNQQSQRLAAAGDIPMTRFMGMSPGGMNATGESDRDNYGVMVAANQKNRLEPALDRLDPILAAHAGLAEPPEYEWIPLFELSEGDQAEVTKVRTETTLKALLEDAVDVDEARERLSQDPWWGELAPGFEPPEPELPPAPVLPVPDPNNPGGPE